MTTETVERPGRIEAPFSDEQVAALNAFQRNGRFHPFTCGGDRSDAAHAADQKARGHGDAGILLATNAGWVCPACGYTQKWAHAAMTTLPAAA